ncbi:MAG TPA: arginase family protein [Kutzneria sp.]
MTASLPLRLIEVPYDSGHRDARMGSGPLALARAGAAARLRERGHTVQERVVEAASQWRSETTTAFELQHAVAAEAAAAREAGQFPLLLAGNCNHTVGMLAGGGLVWLDAHGDFNTPDTSPTGFLDGQALAMAVGRCWTAAVPKVALVPEPNVVLVGARSLDPAEESALRGSEVAWLPPDQVRDVNRRSTVLAELAARVDTVHVHIDLDVYDPSLAPANSFAAPGGLLGDDVRGFLVELAARTRITSAALASYDPRGDQGHRIRDAALDVLLLLAELAA